jgi:beta-mannosidase
MEHVAPRVYYNGSYPTEPLSDTSHGDFQVNVDVHFIAPAATTGTLSVTGGWAGASASQPVTLPAGSSTTTVKLLAKDNAVSLWWPAQTPGAQTRYPINVTFTPASGPAIADSRMIGFRVFTLVTGNDTDPSTLIGRDGQDHFTMRFKVNGANIYSRGGNMIPMEEMEGRSTDNAHRRLVQSAVEGGFNTFRLWGGGIFQWDAWYDACDEFGVLICELFHLFHPLWRSPASDPLAFPPLSGLLEGPSGSALSFPAKFGAHPPPPHPPIPPHFSNSNSSLGFLRLNFRS